MARDKYETARKLLALTASPNAHEAAQAREAYTAYTTRHQLSSPAALLTRLDALVQFDPAHPPTLDETLQRFEEQQRITDLWLAALRDASTK